METMPPFPASAAPGFSRRALLAGAGVLALAAGCTSNGDKRPQVSVKQADQLAKQVTVQESLMAAYAAAASADPALGSEVADLAGQAKQQLDRLKAASPSARTSAASGTASSGSASPAPTPGPDPRAWLRQQVAAAATSHSDACLDQSGARAALLGSIAAGLRGQDGRLA
jgi:hypothetical protein